MRAIRAVIKKEIIHILRDRRTLILVALMPLIQITIYGYAINTDVKHLATALLDEDRSPMSRRLVQAFEQSSYYDIQERVADPAQLRQSLDRGRVKAALRIPPDFEKNLIAGRNSELQLLVDGTDSNPANTALNVGQSVVLDFVQREGLVPVRVLPIDYRPRLWYNPDLKSSFFMIPGLVGLLLQLLVPMITAVSIVREKERGNIEQLLVTPLKSHEIILGKLVPYMAIGLVIATLVVGAANLVFHVPVRGNIFTLVALTMLFITVCLGLGLYASTVADNQQQAAQIIMFFAAPSILLSGFIFPRENMPFLIRHLSALIPLTHFLKISRGIILKGLGFADLLPQIAILTLMASGILILSIRKFQKRLS